MTLNSNDIPDEKVDELAQTILRETSPWREDDVPLDNPVQIDDGTRITGIQSDPGATGNTLLVDDGGNTVVELTFEDIHRAEVDANKRTCHFHNCTEEVYWWNLETGICPGCREQYTFHTTYPHNFGIITLQDSGHVWEQQTCGVRCHHVFIEGVYIPVRKPEQGDLLHRLRDANRQFDGDSVETCWEEIDNRLRFTYEEVSAPDGYPKTQEGLKWIRITGVDEGYGVQVEGLVGETVAFIYPNCD